MLWCIGRGGDVELRGNIGIFFGVCDFQVYDGLLRFFAVMLGRVESYGYFV
jgi:hypothetical protein